MAGRLAIDFGTSNTVIANWDSMKQTGIIYPLPEYGRFLQVQSERICLIPSLVHIGAAGKFWYGQQVLQRNLGNSPRTFQWMKRYIAMRNPSARNIDGKSVNYFEAAEEFLSKIISSTIAEMQIEDEEVAFTVPVEAFEHYENWLYSTAQKAGIKRIRFIDEPSAAALGYSAKLFSNQAYLVFDFGGGTLDVSIVKQEEALEAGEPGRSRVLGKAGTDFGGSTIDEWLYQDVLSLNALSEQDPEVEQISRLLLSECEALKEKLSFLEEADLTVMNPLSGSVIAAHYSRQKFEELLEKKDAYQKIDQTIRRAMNAARERGFDEEDIKVVLMVGGCSQIPSVQTALKRIFGRDKVKIDHPLDAVARGAAAFVAGQRFDDYLQHDYAIKYLNTSTNTYEYRPIVRRGTTYPSDSLAKLVVKATGNYQSRLGLLIYEMGANGAASKKSQVGMEIFFDETGNARLTTVSEQEHESRSLFCINEKNPTFLDADPPAFKGESRFEVTFSIDANRRLLITTRDLKEDKIVHQNYPLIKLN